MTTYRQPGRPRKYEPGSRAQLIVTLPVDTIAALDAEVVRTGHPRWAIVDEMLRQALALPPRTDPPLTTDH